MKNLVAQNHDHIEFDACRRLWITVLVTALEQYRKQIEKEEAKRNFRPGPTSARSIAHRYVRSRDCKIVTHLAGFDYNADRMLRFLDGEGPAVRWVRKETEA